MLRFFKSDKKKKEQEKKQKELDERLAKVKEKLSTEYYIQQQILKVHPDFLLLEDYIEKFHSMYTYLWNESNIATYCKNNLLRFIGILLQQEFTYITLGYIFGKRKQSPHSILCDKIKYTLINDCESCFYYSSKYVLLFIDIFKGVSKYYYSERIHKLLFESSSMTVRDKIIGLFFIYEELLRFICYTISHLDVPCDYISNNILTDNDISHNKSCVEVKYSHVKCEDISTNSVNILISPILDDCEEFRMDVKRALSYIDKSNICLMVDLSLFQNYRQFNPLHKYNLENSLTFKELEDVFNEFKCWYIFTNPCVGLGKYREKYKDRIIDTELGCNIAIIDWKINKKILHANEIRKRTLDSFANGQRRRMIEHN